MDKKPDSRNQITENSTSNKVVKLRSYKKLIAYQKSRQLVEEIYALTSRFPRNDFALQTQIQKTAIRDLNYINETIFYNISDLSEEIGRLINGLINSLKAKESNSDV